MCTLGSGRTMVVGPRRMIYRLTDAWFDLRTPRRLELSPPEVAEFFDLPHGDVFDDDSCPRVAVIRHDPALQSQVADLLQTEVLTTFGAGAAQFEPGYDFQAASMVNAPMGGVQFDPNALGQAMASISTGSAGRVAILDTGDKSASSMVDVVGGSPHQAPAADGHGHGTAIGDLIRALRPAAWIEAVRVLDNSAFGPEYQVLNGLIIALWSGRYDVVNASLAVTTHGGCATSLGRSVAYAAQLCSQSGRAMPILVAACGNQPQQLGYPALVDGAEVAVALDWAGNDASYNTQTGGRRLRTVRAFGGTANQPFGTYTQGGALKSFYGSSVAAALVTASHLA